MRRAADRAPHRHNFTHVDLPWSQWYWPASTAPVPPEKNLAIAIIWQLIKNITPLTRSIGKLLHNQRDKRNGANSRGDSTRARIIEHAISLFAEQGYDHASTRDIAALANVHSPSIQYHFNGKANLYFACTRAMVERALVKLDPPVKQVLDLLDRKPGTNDLIDAYCDLFAVIVDISFEPGSNTRRLFTMRQPVATEAAEAQRQMVRDINDPLANAFDRLLLEITGEPDAEMRKIRMFALNGQAAEFLYSRDYLLKYLGWSGFTKENSSQVREVIRDHMTTVLESLSRKKSTMPMKREG